MIVRVNRRVSCRTRVSPFIGTQNPLSFEPTASDRTMVENRFHGLPRGAKSIFFLVHSTFDGPFRKAHWPNWLTPRYRPGFWKFGSSRRLYPADRCSRREVWRSILFNLESSSGSKDLTKDSVFWFMSIHDQCRSNARVDPGPSKKTRPIIFRTFCTWKFIHLRFVYRSV